MDSNLHRHDKCYRVQKCKGTGLYLAPHPRLVECDGLFLKRGNDVSDGADPFMNIPVRDVYKNKVFCLSSLSLILTVEQYG